MRRRKSWFKGLAFILGFCLIINLSKDILRLLKAGEEVERAKERLRELKREQGELLKKREFYQSKEFVEKEARNRLNMAKPGEIIVILPPDFKIGKKKSEFFSEELPNWQKWWQLFF